MTLGLSNLANLLVVVYAYQEPDTIRLMSAWRANRRERERPMRKAVAERYRDIDFSRAKRGAVVKPEAGKTKISIRLDDTAAALLDQIHRTSTLEAVRQVVREELAPYGGRRGAKSRLRQTRVARR